MILNDPAFCLFRSEHDLIQPQNNEVVGDSILRNPKPLGLMKNSNLSTPTPPNRISPLPPTETVKQEQEVRQFCNLLHHVSELKSEKWERRGEAERTVYTRGCRSRRSCHLSREAGAFDRLGSLFDLVLVAASVCGDYLACSCFHVDWKHKKWQQINYRLSANNCLNIYIKSNFFYVCVLLKMKDRHTYFWISFNIRDCLMLLCCSNIVSKR